MQTLYKLTTWQSQHPVPIHWVSRPAVRKSTLRDARCTKCALRRMHAAQNVCCAECALCRIRSVQNVLCAECALRRMCATQNALCAECALRSTWSRCAGGSGWTISGAGPALRDDISTFTHMTIAFSLSKCDRPTLA